MLIAATRKSYHRRTPEARVEVQKQNVEAFAGRRAHGSATIAAQNLRLPQIKAVELRALEAANGGQSRGVEKANSVTYLSSVESYKSL